MIYSNGDYYPDPSLAGGQLMGGGSLHPTPPHPMTFSLEATSGCCVQNLLVAARACIILHNNQYSNPSRTGDIKSPPARSLISRIILSVPLLVRKALCHMLVSNPRHKVKTLPQLIFYPSFVACRVSSMLFHNRKPTYLKHYTGIKLAFKRSLSFDSVQYTQT